jgi:alkanesulfonate monooxygenase SsuD/methylene tetrahydromethanopterin reductase-like flavin-dependent oxidoreductase (luciferase family)
VTGGKNQQIKVFVELSQFATIADRNQLEDAGVSGVSMADHLFTTTAGIPRDQHVSPAPEPLTTLAAVAALSATLHLQTVVANTAWIHPGLLLRQFNQLAVLAGGDRVTAGLGAGWSAEEFDALGMTMLPFRRRMERLEEVLALARQLYQTGTATTAGQHVTVRDLPLSPVPDRPPRLLVGGGSDRVLEMAGRYADIIDLHGDPRHGRIAGTTMAQAQVGDKHRRALTTVEELADRYQLVRAAAAAAGRDADAVSVSTQIIYAAFGSRSDVAAAERDLCSKWARIPDQRLNRSPYLLFGEPGQMAEALHERQEAYGLTEMTILAEAGIAQAPADPLAFCRAVIPLL